MQMRTIENRMSKYLSIDEQLLVAHRKKQFQCASLISLLWSLFNILLLVVLHVPIEHQTVRAITYYIQIVSFLVDPILNLLIFRSLSIITLLKSSNGIYFV